MKMLSLKFSFLFCIIKRLKENQKIFLLLSISLPSVDLRYPYMHQQSLKRPHPQYQSSKLHLDLISSDPSNPLSKSQQLIKSIIDFKGQTDTPLIQKYTLSYLITLLDKNKIESIEKVYKIKQQGFNLLEFIRFFLNAIEHSETETLYLTMALVDLFKIISKINGFTQRIKFIHLTDFVCNSILDNGGNDGSANITGCSNSYSENKIEMKLIPSHRPINPNYEIKDYITNPPKIYGNKEETVYKLGLSNAKVDKIKHDSVITASFFSFEYKKIFSLDALADGISIYDTNCRLEKKLRPQNSKIKKDVVVLSFAYSQRQQRIGAVLKDFTLSFWDFVDNFQFEKVISTASSCQEYQTNIWYLEYFQSWITSDKTGTVYIWNLEKQVPDRKIQCKYKGKINEVCEIPCLNILAIAQECRVSRLNQSKTDNNQAKIILYNYFRGQQVGEISSMNQMRIPHTLQYSETYQVLLSAGFSKKINIFEINHKYLDTNLKGELLGHQNLITNFILVKKTPMVVSSDDKGKVKIWDLRNYKCIQTLDFRDKTIITRLLDMVQIGKLGVLGSRINFLEYDQKLQIVKKYQSKQKNIPLSINYIYESNQLLIVTKKDVRLYNMSTGAIQKVFCDYHNKDEEIVAFKYYELMKKILIGNEKGEIKLFNLGGITDNQKNFSISSDGKSIKQQKLQGFQNGLVTHIEYDQDNKLFLTCGQNGTINVEKRIQNLAGTDPVTHEDEQKQTQNNKLRPKLLNHKSKDILQNQNRDKNTPHKQLTSKSINSEQWTIIRQMKGNFSNKEITTLAFSVYHGMIAIGSTSNEIYVWDYEYAKILFSIFLPETIEPTAMTFLNGFSILIIAASNGQVYFVKLLRHNKHQHQDKNAQKTGSPKIIYLDQILSFKDNRIVRRKPGKLELSEEEDPNDYVTQILVDICLKGTQSKSNNIEFCKLYFAYCSGKMAIIELNEFLKRHPIIPHRKFLPTYNPERQLKEQFSIQLQKQKCLHLDIKLIEVQSLRERKFEYRYKFMKPHNSSINSMKILEFDKHYLVTCGNDERIKIWEENQGQFTQVDEGRNLLATDIELLGDFNVNHPLPYLWNFSIKEDKKIRDKIMFSLKIIQSIFKKFGSDISTGQSKILKLQNFFKVINKSSNKDQQFNYLTEPIEPQLPIECKKKYLFHQEFSKKDLHYDEIKKFNFYEIGGPSLRQLEFKKKIDIIQKEWQASKLKEEEQKNLLMAKIQHRAQKNEEKQQIINFLQDRQLVKKKSKKEDEDQLAKKIYEELTKIQSHQLMNSNKDSICNSSFNDMKMMGQTNIMMMTKMMRNENCFMEGNNQSQQKLEFGYLLRKHHLVSNNRKNSLQSKDHKGFEEYYRNKRQTKQKHGEHLMRNASNTMSHKKIQSVSMKNSKIGFKKIYHQRTQKKYSFQHILKDMNNRVLLSRQTRNTVSTFKKNNIEGEDEKKYDFPTDREQRAKKLAKTHNGHKSMQNTFDIRNNFMA